jgi:hypothetical protein
MIRNARFAILAVCTLALALAQGRAHAQTVPFVIIGQGVAPQGLPLPGQPPRPHWAYGLATDIFAYYGTGEVATDTANFQQNGTITGEFGSPVPYRFIAANGDVLACYYGNTEFGASHPGTFELVPMPEAGEGVYVAYFVAEFVPYQPACTGKFAGATGSWIMYAETAPFVLGSTEPISYWWTGEGTLTFGQVQH